MGYNDNSKDSDASIAEIVGEVHEVKQCAEEVLEIVD